ncbi:MAG TPA: DNA alkylation repair protein [Tepidisphaeraceae bacterium]|nr:DNA alkylation repair protein [Tepidisphaeraceae bacterium]
MTLEEILKTLEKTGSPQTRKTYATHGVTGEMFGVSFATYKDLAKKIKVDHELAKSLWKTGNHDARILATFVGDPKQADAKLLEAWIRDVNVYVLSDALARFATHSPAAIELMKKWIKSPDEWYSSTGYSLLANLIGENLIDDEFLESHLDVIEKQIHKQPNRTRYSMNNVVIQIGLRPKLEKKAIAAAKKIGAVEVDHGLTNCKTPDAIDYIAKTKAYRATKAAKKPSPKKKSAKA